MPPNKLTPEIIAAAIQGFEFQKSRIDARIAELRAMLPGDRTDGAATPAAPGPKPRKFSAAARRRMALAQKARWANIRGESQPTAPATPEPETPKRRISEEGMKRIIAATKKRWRLQKAAARAKSTAAKKTAPSRTRAAVKSAPAKSAKRAPVKKVAAAKKTAQASAPTVADATAQ